MEKWEAYLKETIPKGMYTTNIRFGEKNGLIIELLNGDDVITIEFGNVISFRVLDEGIVQTDIYCNEEIEKYKKCNFENVIYKVDGGRYAKEIEEIADGYMDVIDYYHFIIITQNYNIDIITSYLPEIHLDKKS